MKVRVTVEAQAEDGTVYANRTDVDATRPTDPDSEITDTESRRVGTLAEEAARGLISMVARQDRRHRKLAKEARAEKWEQSSSVRVP